MSRTVTVEFSRPESQEIELDAEGERLYDAWRESGGHPWGGQWNALLDHLEENSYFSYFDIVCEVFE